MDDLIQNLQQLNVQEWINNTHWKLDVRSISNYETSVYALEYIPEKAFIGEITGEHKYAWEVIPASNMIWIDDECVLDCSQTPKCITSMLREGFYDGLHANCLLDLYYTSSETHVGLFALTPIFEGQELIFRRRYDYI